MQDVLDVLPKENLVLEIVETTNVTKDVIERVAAYHREGGMYSPLMISFLVPHILICSCLFSLL